MIANQKNLIFKKFAQIALHLLFWSGVLIFYTYFFGFGTTDFNYVFSFSLFLMPITIGLTYMMIYRLIPEYFLKKEFFKFGLYSLYTLIISFYLIVVSVFVGLIYLSNFQVEKMSPISRNIGFVMVGVYLIVILVCAFKLLKLNSEASIKNSNLEKEIFETRFKLKEQELNYLKMQIHPHFLFNTLNTLYGFALKKSDRTPEMILKLSSLLDYLLYQADKPFVSLKQEVSHIEDYLALEKMRFAEVLKLEFSKNNVDLNYKVAPMLLLPFVENSFKHGSIENGTKKVILNLSCINEILIFEIENNKKVPIKPKGGIGLENIKKRLDLVYRSDYELAIMDTERTFKVKLTILKSLEND